MKWFLIFAGLSTGCVVRQYGGVTPTSVPTESLKPVDFSDVEKQLETLIERETENVDRRDRLEAAWELCQKTKTLRPSAQHENYRYMMRLVEIEKRIQDSSTDAVANPDQQTFTPIAAISAERLQESEVVPTATTKKVSLVPPDAGASAVMDAARERMAADDLKGALDQLELCQGQACGAATVTLWREVRDRYVYQRREAAGTAFIKAQKSADSGARKAAFESVRNDLESLQNDYPESRYNEGVKSSLSKVDAAIKAEEQSPQ